jgi:hypothetical protein
VHNDVNTYRKGKVALSSDLTIQEVVGELKRAKVIGVIIFSKITGTLKVPVALLTQKKRSPKFSKRI